MGAEVDRFERFLFLFLALVCEAFCFCFGGTVIFWSFLDLEILAREPESYVSFSK